MALTKGQTQSPPPPPHTHTLNTACPPHNSHEVTLVAVGHTERLPGVPVGEACAVLMGVGGRAVGRRDGRRLPHRDGSTVTTHHFMHHIIIYTVYITYMVQPCCEVDKLRGHSMSQFV